jgi:gluconate kinase
MNLKQTKIAMQVLFAADITPHLIGEAGIGKSAGVYQFAKEHDYDVAEVRVGLMADAGDLVGIQEFIKCEQTGQPLSTRHVLPDWFMKAAVQVQAAGASGRKVIIFCDEMSRGHKDLLQAIFELVYDKSLKGVKMRGDCKVVAASNPPTEDYAGSMEFSDDAFQDRFCHLKVEPSVEEFLEYGKKTAGFDYAMLEFLGDNRRLIEAAHKPWTLDFVKPSRRSWDRVNKVIAITPTIPGGEEVEFEIICGIVGFEAANAFQKFRKTFTKSIKADEVLNHYSQKPLVKESVTKAVQKDRTDMLAKLNEELVEILGKMEGITQTQADNLADLVHDLPVEHAYALALKLTTNGNNRAIMNIDGKTPGLYAHKKFVERIEYIKEERMKIKAQAEKDAQDQQAKRGPGRPKKSV